MAYFKSDKKNRNSKPEKSIKQINILETNPINYYGSYLIFIRFRGIYGTYKAYFDHALNYFKLLNLFWNLFWVV